jgi:putative membrane protein
MEQKKDYGIWIKIVSIAIPVVVAILFGVRVEYDLPIFLPPIYATINAITALLLVLALVAIKAKKIQLHQRLMQSCIVLSLVFLVMYIAYHMTTDPTPFGGEGYMKTLYFFILISHIILSIALIPLVLISYVRAFQKEFPAHKKISKITFPIWLYVASTGVIVYLMIAPYYIQ